MNKKAQFDVGRKFIYYLLVIFFLIVIFIFLNTTFAKFDYRILDSSNKLSSNIVATEMIMSPFCFAYFDEEIERTYPGIIDKSKFNNENIYKSCGKYYENKFFVYLIDFENESTKDLNLIIDKPDEYYFNERKNLPSVGNTKIRNVELVSKEVLIKEKNQIKRGILEIGFEI